MRTLRLTIAYDGTNYVGWQRQENGTSVQQLVEEAFAPLTRDARSRPSVAGAGRTDAGVHAAGQVASVNVAFDLSVDAVQRALNVRLPPDIRILDVTEAPLGFHARFHARGKVYRYRLVTAPVLSPFDRWFAWHAPATRRVDAMRDAARLFVGRHDFASFQARGSATRATVRTVDRVDVNTISDGLVVEIEGGGFLRHMARAIVGTLAEVGAGVRDPDSIPPMLEVRDRRAGGPTAPACGLMLMSVRY
jgi:tRNA pseudouridine38-40 synthase